MVDTSTIVSVVLAIVSLLGTLAIAFINFFTTASLEKRRERRLEARALQTLTEKYSQPLSIAAYELQARLYELLEYPISKQHLETEEGLDDIKIFTCYKFAQFLAWTHILKTKTQYFSFTTDPTLKNIGDLILRLNEEFDRRRDSHGQNIGVWPGSRILICERMINSALAEKEVPLDRIVISYDEFHRDWKTKFQSPMGYFCQWIDDMVVSRKDVKQHWDDAMRCTQHNLVDMVKHLGQSSFSQYLSRCQGPWECDCDNCGSSLHPESSNTAEPPKLPSRLTAREESRRVDKGLRPWYNHQGVDKIYDASITLTAMREMTSTQLYNQGPRAD